MPPNQIKIWCFDSVNQTERKDSMNQEMVEQYIEKTVAMAYRYKKRTHNKDGIISEALLCLCKISDDLVNRNNAEGYLGMHVRAAITTFIAADRLIPVSRSSWYKGRTPPSAYPIEDAVNLACDTSEMEETVRVFELIEAAGLNEREKEIALLLSKGYSFEELATDLNLSVRRIRQIRRSIGEKLIQVMNNERKTYANFIGS